MSESPVRRIATEVVVIVASILLAFSLDAWWDERQEEDRVGELLAAVVDDFGREIAGLDSIIAVNHAYDSALERLIATTGSGSQPIAPDTVTALLGTVVRDAQIYDSGFGALTALLSSGGLERIRDAELRRDLAGWPAELADLQWEHDQVYDAIDRALASLKDLRLMSSVTSEQTFWDARVRATVRSPAHREHEAQLKLQYVLYTSDLERIRRRADALVVRIRSYLEGSS